MGEIAKGSASAKAVLLVISVVVVAAIVVGALVWHPWAVNAARQDGANGPARTESGLVARAEFPSSPGLAADVQFTETTQEMVSAAPASFRNLATAIFTVRGGDFPAAGATITVDLPTPAAQDHGVMIAHWNEQGHVWEPVPTDLSADRMHASAKVSHFSLYGFFDYLFNAVNQVAGNAASSGVQCDSPMPVWVDPQFVDDINSPILWCGGKDMKNADILVAKMKMNRGSAAKITTAIKPAWVWSDLWDSMGPETMLQMTSTATMLNPAKLGDDYIVQPLGEYDFGFSRAELEKFYADGRWDKPLVQVGLGWQYTLFGALYDELKDRAQGNIAGAVAMLALGQCSYDLASASGAQSAAEKLGGVMSCIGSSIDAVDKGSLAFVSKKLPGADSARARELVRPVLSKLKMVTGIYSTAAASLKLFTTIGDMTLPDISRQFLYQPSIAAIKAAAQKKAASTDTLYSGSAVDVDFSLSYPSTWSVSGSNGHLTVSNAAGEAMGQLDLLPVWGAEGPPMSAPVEAESNYGDFAVQQPRTPCASCTPHVGTKVVDSRKATAPAGISQDPVSALGWPLPVVVSTTLSLQQAPATVVDPRLMTGIVTVESGVKGSNGDSKRVVIFDSHKYFRTVDEAKAWMTSPEHRQVEKMIASVRVR